MVAYVFDKPNNTIHTKIEDVSFVDDNEDNKGKIIGVNTTAIFGNGSDYIILQYDTINLNIGDVIDTFNLEDSRNYFLKGKEAWFHEQLQKQDEKMKLQQDKMERLLQLLEVKEQ